MITELLIASPGRGEQDVVEPAGGAGAEIGRNGVAAWVLGVFVTAFAWASDEFFSVLVKIDQRGRVATGDLLESVRREVVLEGEDRPFARDDQLCRPRADYGSGHRVVFR
jgi:hypothetical protein